MPLHPRVKTRLPEVRIIKKKKRLPEVRWSPHHICALGDRLFFALIQKIYVWVLILVLFVGSTIYKEVISIPMTHAFIKLLKNLFSFVVIRIFSFPSLFESLSKDSFSLAF
jgi:hypothetical protein